jgi:hypothetical protein
VKITVVDVVQDLAAKSPIESGGGVADSAAGGVAAADIYPGTAFVP